MGTECHADEMLTRAALKPINPLVGDLTVAYFLPKEKQ